MSAPSVDREPAVAPIDCETAVRRLWDFLDARLSAAAHAEVEAHLTACALCPPHFAFSRRMRSALAESREADAAPDDAAATLRARVRAALRGAEPPA